MQISKSVFPIRNKNIGNENLERFHDLSYKPWFKSKQTKRKSSIKFMDHILQKVWKSSYLHIYKSWCDSQLKITFILYICGNIKTYIALRYFCTCVYFANVRELKAFPPLVTLLGFVKKVLMEMPKAAPLLKELLQESSSSPAPRPWQLLSALSYSRFARGPHTGSVHLAVWDMISKAVLNLHHGAAPSILLVNSSRIS